MRGLLLVLIALATLLTATPALAASHPRAGVVGDAIPLCVIRADPRMTPRALFASPGRFDCQTPQASFGAGDYFVLSGPVSIGRNWPAVIRVASLWQERTTLHALYADGSMATIVADQHGLSRHIQLGAIVEYRLPVQGVPVVRLLWHVEGAIGLRGIVLGATSATLGESAASNVAMATIYAGFAGLCVALLIYNLAVWAALKHRFQLAYCAMLLGLLVYAASSSGALAWLAPTMSNNDRIRINYVALASSAVAALAFARSFFGAEVFAGWLGRACIAVAVALIGTALLFAGLAPYQAPLFERLYSGAFVALVIVVLPILWRAWRLRRNYLWLFAIAWAVPIGFATLRIASNFDLIGWSFWIDNSTLLAMALEALLSSIAVAYRIRLLSRERDEAREQEIAARLLADTDPLTGLLNRRAFLRQAIGREADQALLVVDLDHFKQVNETIGHDGGDEVLRVIARTLRAASPPDALVARIGGEEFAVVADAAAMPSANRLLDRLRGATLPYDLVVTASIGTCTGPLLRETDWKLLYRRADEALFAAKAAGRDRVRDAAPVALAA